MVASPSIGTAEDAFAFHLKALGFPKPIREFLFALPRRYRADFAWPTQRIIVEIEGGLYRGGRHTTIKGFTEDCRKYNLAAQLGYRVFRFTTAMVNNGEAVECMEHILGLRQ